MRVAKTKCAHFSSSILASELTQKTVAFAFAAAMSVDGLPGCPCLDAATVATALASTTHAFIAGTNYSFGASGTYPTTYGVDCGAHDSSMPPYCGPQWCGADKVVVDWCANAWCWVDVNACDGVAAPSVTSYFAPVVLAYSYETCGRSNTFDDFYATATAPRPPPPAAPPPPPPPAAPPPWHTEGGFVSAITAGSIAGGLVVVAALVVAIVACARKARRLERRQQLEARKRAQAALHTTHHMNHSAVLVPASTFVSLGELRAYEDLRDEGKLIYRDSFSALAHGDDYIVFFSHQWTSFDHPDPANVQYPVMVAALLKLAEEKEADNAVREGKTRASEAGDATEVVSILERMLVWVDYSSIPQRSEATLKLAIQSLSAYSSLAAEFVIVAPTCHHLQTGAVCDFESYRRRAWCRAEQLCHLFRNGMDDMWLATSPKHIERLHTSKKHPTNATPEELYERGAITSEEVRARRRRRLPSASSPAP